MKRYVATRRAGSTIVKVVTEYAGSCRVTEAPLVHREKHSASLEWGYGGSGPADLARSILWDLLGYAPDAALYQDFKNEVIAVAPAEGFELIDSEIATWLQEWRARYLSAEAT